MAKKTTNTAVKTAKNNEERKKRKPSSSSNTKKKSGSSPMGKNMANKSKQKKSDSGDVGILQEIGILVALAVCLILLLGVFNRAGNWGMLIHQALFGCFGILAYIFPFVLFALLAFLISNFSSKRAGEAWGKAILSLLSFFSLCGIVQLLNGKRMDSSYLLMDYYHHGGIGLNGGLIGGFLSSTLQPFVGILGAYVILVIFFLISIILLSGRSFLRPLKKGSKKVVSTAKDDFHRIREEQQKKNEEREAGHRVDQKVQGVNFSASLLSSSQSKIKAEETTGEKTEETEEKQDLSAATTAIEEESWREEIHRAPSATRMIIRREKRTLSELEELDHRESIPEDIREVREDPQEKVLEEIEEEILQEPEIEISLDFAEDIHEAEWEEETSADPFSAYDEFDAPHPETIVKQHDHPEILQEQQKDPEPGSISSPSKEQTVQQEKIQLGSSAVQENYIPPKTSLLKLPPRRNGMKEAELKATATKLAQTLRNFGVGVSVTNISCGPSVTRYELQPEQGVKVSRIVSLSNDIKLNLAAADIRIEAPIPGKAAVGIEVPNAENQTVFLRELLDSEEFQKSPSKVSFAVGKDIAGKVVVADLARMPHLLIAGATGSGKSVCINTLIMSILYKAKPDEVKLIMIDPKVVELAAYNGIPHLLIPVVTDPKKAAGALNWAVAEMTDRYRKFAEMSVRDIKGYNRKVEEDKDSSAEKLCQIVVIVDELADLMMVAPGEVEEAICRLAQLARAAGIHLVLATQRPSVNVITGLIKANVPSRIAFAVSSGVDSRTIIDMVGAEKLLGKGDMLFYPTGNPKPVRVQGAFVSDDEVSKVVQFIAEQTREIPSTNLDLERHLESSGKDNGSVGCGERDELFVNCGRFIIENEKASIGNLQRAFRIGFNRAARIMDQLAQVGVVGPEEGTKARQILMSMEEFDELLTRL